MIARIDHFVPTVPVSEQRWNSTSGCSASRPSCRTGGAGTDFIIAMDVRIAAVYLFFDKLP